ncbi:DUF6326 family protein [Altibacter sp. HG106]|uniref:DUF6326 family protein n=1 Tax=Altibacter sp. HG106 TaxID=3023937 RepID=UPI002350F340|nr:DUF6326 family protein [Altibacter sp. HG106]MDC7995318.1 DUF6326 family protein [Altibacter sp. HG106]
MTINTIDVRIKLAALWASVTFCYLYGDYFELYTPGKVEDLISGANILDSPMKLLIASIVLAIPSIMVAFSVLLPRTLNRILNLVFGLLFTMMMLFIGFNSMTEWYAFYVFLAFLESALTLCIIWYAWKWKRS